MLMLKGIKWNLTDSRIQFDHRQLITTEAVGHISNTKGFRQQKQGSLKMWQLQMQFRLSQFRSSTKGEAHVHLPETIQIQATLYYPRTRIDSCWEVPHPTSSKPNR